jgi:translocation and assembly module TamB
LVRGLAIAALVLGALLVPLAWLVGTRSGLEFVWQRVASRLGSGIEVEALDGRLLGPVRAMGVTLDAGSLHIEAQQLELEWHPMRLLRGTFAVERLALSGVDVTQRSVAAPESAGPSSSPELPDSIALPLDVIVDSASIDGFRYFASPDAAPVPVDRIALAAQLEKQRWRIEHIEVAAPRFTAAGEASLVPTGAYATGAALDWTLRWPDFPQAHGRTRLSGDLERLTLQQTVDAPYRLDAQIALARPFSDRLIDGRLDASLSSDALGLDVPFETIDASASLGGSLSAVDVMADASLAAGAQGVAHVALDGTYSTGTIDVRKLEVSQPAVQAVAQREQESAAPLEQESAAQPGQGHEPSSDPEPERKPEPQPQAVPGREPGRLTLAGKIALEPEADVALAGDWRNLSWPLVGPPTFESPKGSLRLSGTPETLTADLSAEVGAKGTISGTVKRSGEQLDANLDWRDVVWPVNASEPEARSGEGKLSINGTLDDYRFNVDADLALGAASKSAASSAVTSGPSRATAGRVHAEGTGTLERLDFDRIEAEVLGGKVTGTANAAWKPSVAASVDLTAEGLDPGKLDQALEGRLDARVQATAALADGSPSAKVTKLTLDGALRGRAVHVDALGRYAEDRLELERLRANSGKSSLHAEGSVGTAADLTFGLESPDLGDFWPGFTGRLEARGSVRGPRATPIVAVDAKGASIRLPQAAVDNLELHADLDVSGEDRSTLELKLEDAVLAGTEVTSLEVKGDGDARAHSLSLAAKTAVGTADIAFRGSVEGVWKPGFVWRFDLERATLAYPSLAAWSLENTLAGRFTSDGVVLDRGCWHSGEARLCVDVTEPQNVPRAGIALTALPFSYFSPLLPDSVSVAGELTATADVRLPRGAAPRVDMTLHTTPGHIGKIDEEDPAATRAAPAPSLQGLAFGAGEGRIVSDGTSATIDLLWPFESQGRLDLHAVVDRRPDQPVTASTIRGDAAIEVRDLSFVPNVIGDVANTAGRIDGDVALSGTLAAPRLEGRIALEDGRADLIGPGITVENLELAVVGDGSGRLEVDAKAESGGGRLAADGTLRLEGATPLGELHLSGERFELYSTSDATVFISPDLRLAATDVGLRLDGSVGVPSASITPQVLGNGAVTVSPDQVIVGANGEPEERNLPRPLSAQVQLELGDDVSFTGYGLKARLAGGLQITETPGEPTTATGEVRIEQGTYEAYGQMLDIRRGRLTFAGGPIERPGLDIEAVRQATEDILVGARVRGTLAEPELSLFSEPPLPEQEQLSYLVLGRSLNNVSSSETSALQNAAIALGLKGGNVVSERLNKSLGFQEFGIETKPGEGATSASFVIGKYLSPSLYVSYGFGLFQPVNTLTLRYAISSRWRLVTESSSQMKSGDLIYHIERGE